MALTQIRGNTQIIAGTVTDTQISASANIALTKLHDGTLLVKSDGSVPFTVPIAGVDPVAPSDLATKNYVDGVATGLDVKQSVRALATANITLSGTQTVDGVSLVAADRVLVAGQTDATTNGIYSVVAGGPWTRSSDADNSPAGEVTSGMFTFIEEGSVFGGSGWVLATANPIVLGTTDLEFVQFSSAGVIQAGAGLTKTGNTLDVVSSNGGIVVSADAIALTLADGTLAITGSGLKLASLTTGKILIGDGTNTAAAQTVSGDITLTSGGVATIANDAVTNVKILTGTIALNKLVSGTSAQIIVADGSGVPTYVTVSGDITNTNTGAFTISNDAVTTVKILDQNVTLAKIVNLAAGNIIVGTTAGPNASVAVSGDATLSQTGVLSVNAATVVRVADVITREIPTGAVDGTNPTYVLANTPKAGTECVFLNGVLQDVGGTNDYTISGATITFTFNPSTGDKVRVNYLK